MSAFELNSFNKSGFGPSEQTQPEALTIPESGGIKPPATREECIITPKVYDSCRTQDCLSRAEIGYARAAENKDTANEKYFKEGEIITPPDNAASVTIDKLKVKRIIVSDKKLNPFKNGFWDIDLKYVFEYRLVFREADGAVICSVRANSIYNKKVTLFGSISTDAIFATDMFGKSLGDSLTLDADPFVLVEAKAVALSAEIKHRKHSEAEILNIDGRSRGAVEVTIGLFTIIKLFRIVQLLVESKGFCIPPVCKDDHPVSPCEFFERMDFPWDMFSPPKKPIPSNPGDGDETEKPVRKYNCDEE